MNNILYCGMADDILTPINLVPDFDTIFAIDSFDSAFARNYNWEGQKEDILEMLSKGDHETSHHREVHLKYDKEVPIIKLDESCEIISHSDDEVCFRVEFKYLSKIRNLVYFHHKNYYTKWNEEIQDINHLMSMGAEFQFNDELVDVSYTRKFPEIFSPIVEDKEVCISSMIKSRMAKDCLYYNNWADGPVIKEVKRNVRGSVYVHNLNEVI